VTVELLRRGARIERALELAGEAELYVGGAELVIAGPSSAISGFAGALELAGFGVGNERRLPGSLVRERVAEHDGVTIRLRTV
jgi:hypothetical protein